MEKAFKEQTKTIKEQEEEQVKAIQNQVQVKAKVSLLMQNLMNLIILLTF